MTDRMLATLAVLAEADSKDRYGLASLIPNEIARKLGFEHGGRRHGSGAAGKGGWSGWMAPANRVIGTLNALRGRECVAFGSRSDGLSGTAYLITSAGYAELSRAGDASIEAARRRVRVEAERLNKEGRW